MIGFEENFSKLNKKFFSAVATSPDSTLYYLNINNFFIAHPNQLML
jgi:hypothetical protein